METSSYYSIFKDNVGNRDAVFDSVLSHFKPNPLNILEIGCARNLDPKSRQSDGWSTCFWADYLMEFGGSLDVFDISQESLDNCKILLEEWINWNLRIFFFNNWQESFDQKYDLVFLDGGDDPQQTLDQFKVFEEQGVEVILVDDFHTKGKLLNKYKAPDSVWTFDNGHQLAAYGLNLGIINLKLL